MRLGPAEKLWRLIVPWKPLPFDAPEILTCWPASKASTVTVSPTVSSPRLVAELDERAQRRRAGLLEVAELGLGERFSRTAPKRELDGLVAVALGGADAP